MQNIINQICTNKDELTITMINRIVDMGNHIDSQDTAGHILASDSAKWAATLTPSKVTNLEFVVLKLVCVELGLFVTGPQLVAAREMVEREIVTEFARNILGVEGGLPN